MKSSRRSFLATGLVAPAAFTVAGRGPEQAAPAPAGLQFRKLGKTGLKVTSVGFGCMITSDASVITRAADMGINYFDTARVYQGGNNERMVGAALKGKRNQIVLSTKTPGRDKAGALATLDTSLTELGTDHVDIWYLHSKTRAEDLTDELIDAQQTAKQAGKIRFAGVSSHKGQELVIPAAIKSGKIDVVLISYNFTMAATLDPLIEDAKKAGIGVVAMKVMAGGFRTNKEGTPNYGILKREHAMTAALRWVLKNPSIDTTIPSMTDADQLEENFRAMAEKFSPADEKTLAAHLERIRPLYCRMCGACDGACPEGVPVAEVLRSVMYAEGYGQFPLGREHYASLGVDARCEDCAGCRVQCPNGVHVAQRLRRAQELFA
jgi:aryl-alcohol dehydrogenase-like predicted oxidoreductase